MEQSFLAWLRGRTASLPQAAVGIGDDAAILELPAEMVGAASKESLVLCTDMIVDGVDFLASEHALRSIGRKAVLINLSDLAAMAAKPWSMLVTLSLPDSESTRIAAEVYEGILEVAKEYQLSICGGDITVYHGPLAISVTMVGLVPADRRWVRSGAKVGDAIVVTGAFGGSILGRHLDPTPRVELALDLAAHWQVHAAIDVSDGLSLDLDRLCAASGVGAEIDRKQIPIHADAIRLSEQDGIAAEEHAWGDGEDFELILAVDPSEVDRLLASPQRVPLTRIGTFTSRTGLWNRQRVDERPGNDGTSVASKGEVKYSSQLVRLSPRGFIHGRR